MNALAGEATIFPAEDWSTTEPGRSNTYLANFMAPEKLVLKIGAQVMLIKNLDPLLVNGTIGKVVGFGVAALEDDDELGEDDEDYEAHQKKKLKIAADVNAGKIELAPIIEWRTPSGIEKRCMSKEEFKVEDNIGKKQASRKQASVHLSILLPPDAN